MSKIFLIPIDVPGSCRTGSLRASYQEILDIVGFEENVEDDPYKVDASWGFKDLEGRKAFIWCYKTKKEKCLNWSTYGSKSLLRDLFGFKFDED